MRRSVHPYPRVFFESLFDTVFRTVDKLLLDRASVDIEHVRRLPPCQYSSRYPTSSSMPMPEVH